MKPPLGGGLTQASIVLVFSLTPVLFLALARVAADLRPVSTAPQREARQSRIRLSITEVDTTSIHAMSFVS